MLTVSDPLPEHPQRILIAGVSGAGKSTLARRLAALLGIEYTELDSLFHGPNWVPRAEFMNDVDHLTQEPTWVSEWQYAAVRRLLAQRADILIWLDYPMPVSMVRLIRRTVRRRSQREELWNSNYEGPLWGIFTDSDHIIRWGWRTRNKLKVLVPTLEEKFPGLRVVRLRSPREADVWLGRLAERVSASRVQPRQDQP
ncbi:AAA family ATPase [Arthrobacter sp. BF1]|uniref:AAA family ATPase n=1 Tax=Arthrobacter sp. BF1 TaxID=2821145 RepID=UPI001C4FFDFC|nr:AAA family ATPase [Arthrobacter sp. BF1]